MEPTNDPVEKEKEHDHVETDKFHSTPPEKYSKKRQAIFLGIIFIVLVILFLIGFFPRMFHWEKLVETANTVYPITVNIQTLEPSKKLIELILPSTTQAMRITPIWSRSDGYIKNFYVDIGDNVHKGQLMLDIETPEIDKQLSQGKADLRTAFAKLEIAKISATRWQELFSLNQEAVSEQEVDEKNTNLVAVLSEVESAAANVQRLEDIQGFSKLKAPFQGIITERNIDIGTLVTAGSQENYQQLFQIAQTDVIRVFVNVPQPYFRLIKVGGKTDIFIQEFPERIFKGTIARTSKSLDPLSRTLLTEIHVDNKDGEILIGLYAEVHFHLIPEAPYFIIPTTALVITDGDPQVAIVDDQGKVSLKVVKIGRDFGKTIEITWGLKEGEKMVTNPTERIRDGVIVDLKKSTHKMITL